MPEEGQIAEFPGELVTLRRLLLVLIICAAPAALQAEVTSGYLIPNPAAARDFAMGASSGALVYSIQSQSTNPAGLMLFESEEKWRATLFVNPAAAAQMVRLWESEKWSTSEKIIRTSRLLAHGAGVQRSPIILAVLLTEPVLPESCLPSDEAFDFEPLQGLYRNSILINLRPHPQVAIGGRIDRFYEGDSVIGDGYNYGVLLRQKSVAVGFQYHRFPPEGHFSMHPLDRRGDQTTSAAMAWNLSTLSVSFQVMNLTQKSEQAFLEPHAGVEWRPLRAVALRAGGTQFSRSNRWAWTAGLGLLDANWLRPRGRRLGTPDDVLQLAGGVIYRERTPIAFTGVVTLAWRL
ncbi:MAG: hypothetical protein V1784_07750 [bacterium]